MTKPWCASRALVLISMLVLASPALAAIDVGSDGSDGAFDPSVDSGVCTGGWDGSICTVDLSLAADAAWDTASPVAGRGVYDAAKWAVVFKYSSMNVQPGVAVEFTNHPSRAPVVWLVDGAVTIDGTVDLNGGDGAGYTGSPWHAEPGPGGFRGAMAYVSSPSPNGPGFGPGGAQVAFGSDGYTGAHASAGNSGSTNPTYGNDRVMPLIGGSGGSGRWGKKAPRSGAAGGGAILIAADQSITVAGVVRANGGWGGGNENGEGAGGAIRLASDTIDVPGQLRAVGGWSYYQGGDGRIGIEAVQAPTLTDVAPSPALRYPCAGSPPFPPDCPAEIWPEDLAAPPPEVRIVDVGGQSVPADPRASFSFPLQDVRVADPDPLIITVETKDVPLNWKVRVRVSPQRGAYTEVLATHQGPGSNPGWEEWTVSVAVPNKFSAVQARACDPARGSPYCP